MIRRTVQRLGELVSERGVWGALNYILVSKSPTHIARVYSTDWDPAFSGDREELRICRYPSFRDLDSQVLQQLRSNFGERFVDQFSKKFDLPAQLWIGFWQESPAGICWSRSGRNRSDYFVPITESEATILSCSVLPRFRGKGIYPSMLRSMVNQLHHQDHCARVWIDCHSSNKASIRGIEKAGFLLVGKALRIDLFGKFVRFPRYLRQG